jgi:hypothetical protein
MWLRQVRTTEEREDEPTKDEQMSMGKKELNWRY